MEAELHTPELEILENLNEITGSKFRPIKSNLTKIKALLKAEFTPQEIVEVIQLKTIQWKNNPTMAGYLCPTTLFRESNFEKYYNEVQQVKANPKLYGEYFKSINKIPTSAADNADDLAELYGEETSL
nr:MAG TPA: hypothetical protein [Caudoviricetes sp.]